MRQLSPDEVLGDGAKGISLAAFGGNLLALDSVGRVFALRDKLQPFPRRLPDFGEVAAVICCNRPARWTARAGVSGVENERHPSLWRYAGEEAGNDAIGYFVGGPRLRRLSLQAIALSGKITTR